MQCQSCMTDIKLKVKLQNMISLNSCSFAYTDGMQRAVIQVLKVGLRALTFLGTQEDVVRT